MDKYDSRAIARAIREAAQDAWHRIREEGRKSSQTTITLDELVALLEDVADRVARVGT